MRSFRQLCAGVALVSFTAAAAASWFSTEPPADSVRRIPVIPEKSPVVAASQPTDKSPFAAISAAEQNLALELDPSAERCTGERLAGLCLADATDLPGGSPDLLYAQRWARQSPQEMYDWFHRRAEFGLPTNSQRTNFHRFDAILFTEWTKRDPAAAMTAALACNNKSERGPAVMTIIGTLHKTDPQRAVALAAEHMEFFRGGGVLPFDAHSANYRETWQALTNLPVGEIRGSILARYFGDLWNSRREDCARIWHEMPGSLREELATGSFAGFVVSMSGAKVPQDIPELEGMDAIRRRHVEATGDAAAAAHFVASRSGREWAQRDPAAAIAWAQQHLKGEQRVKGTAGLFFSAATKDFDTALRTWEALPDGVLRARAAGNLAAGAPAERKAEVAALFATLSETDRRIADLARRTAASEAFRPVPHYDIPGQAGP